MSCEASRPWCRRPHLSTGPGRAPQNRILEGARGLEADVRPVCGLHVALVKSVLKVGMEPVQPPRLEGTTRETRETHTHLRHAYMSTSTLLVCDQAGRAHESGPRREKSCKISRASPTYFTLA
jgi:hypothetical protein